MSKVISFNIIGREKKLTREVYEIRNITFIIYSVDLRTSKPQFIAKPQTIFVNTRTYLHRVDRKLEDLSIDIYKIKAVECNTKLFYCCVGSKKILKLKLKIV